MKGRSRAVQITTPVLPPHSSDNSTWQKSRPSPFMERLQATAVVRSRGLQSRAVCTADVEVERRVEVKRNMSGGKTSTNKKKEKDGSYWLRRGDMCVILRSVKKATAVVAVQPNK